jgi:plastocyanin domain-containing protein
MQYTFNYNTVTLIIEIIFAAALLLYFFIRRRPGAKEERHVPQHVEIKLNTTFTPSEVHIEVERPVELVIHRHAVQPIEELFEIEKLEIYEILPAMHTTIINFTPHQRGCFPMILGGERNAGTIFIE